MHCSKMAFIVNVNLCCLLAPQSSDFWAFLWNKGPWLIKTTLNKGSKIVVVNFKCLLMERVLSFMMTFLLKHANEKPLSERPASPSHFTPIRIRTLYTTSPSHLVRKAFTCDWCTYVYHSNFLATRFLNILQQRSSHVHTWLLIYTDIPMHPCISPNLMQMWCVVLIIMREKNGGLTTTFCWLYTLYIDRQTGR